MSEKTKLYITGALIAGVFGAYGYWRIENEGISVLTGFVILSVLALGFWEPKPMKPAAMSPVSAPEPVKTEIYVTVANQEEKKPDSKPFLDI